MVGISSCSMRCRKRTRPHWLTLRHSNYRSRSRQEFQALDVDTPAAKDHGDEPRGFRSRTLSKNSNISDEMDSGEGSITTGTAPSVAGSVVPDSSDLKSTKKQNVFTDPLNWIDPESIFAWNITVHNAMTKEREQISVYNNDTVGSVKAAFVRSTGCDPSIRLFHLVGMTCQELDDNWELRHCMRNRSSLIACEEDLPSLLKNAGVKSGRKLEKRPDSKLATCRPVGPHEQEEGSFVEAYPEGTVPSRKEAAAAKQAIVGRT